MAYGYNSSPLATGSGSIIFPPSSGTGASQAIINSNNQIWCRRLYLPSKVKVGSFSFEIRTEAASSTYEIGIYNDAGTSLLVGTDEIDTSSAGVKNVDVTDTIVGPGFVVLAVGGSSTSVQFLTIGALDSLYAGVFNNTTVQQGVAANAYSSGLPSALGSLTVATSQLLQQPVIKIQGA